MQRLVILAAAHSQIHVTAIGDVHPVAMIAENGSVTDGAVILHDAGKILTQHGFGGFKAEEPQECRAQVDRGLIRQVLTNLVRNAGESFGSNDSGVVTLGLREAERRVIITVRDNGGGMSEAVAKRVFEPFFSKRRGGTGLGLAISETIVEKHGGTIAVESTEGAGTLFRLELPQASTA